MYICSSGTFQSFNYMHVHRNDDFSLGLPPFVSEPSWEVDIWKMSKVTAHAQFYSECCLQATGSRPAGTCFSINPLFMPRGRSRGLPIAARTLSENL